MEQDSKKYYSVEEKNKLIELWNDIEQDIICVVGNIEDGQMCENQKEASAMVVTKLTSFAKLLNHTICNIYMPDNVPLKLIEGSEYFREYMTDVLKKSVATIMHLIELLSNPGTLESIPNIRKLLLMIGEISLAVRFDILTTSKELLNSDVEQVRTWNEDQYDYYQIRPLWERSIRRFLPRYDFDDTAIVMQGPVLLERDFTYETLARYRKIYPEITIVLSTWVGTVSKIYKKRLEAIEISVVENEKPEDAGPSNVMMQLASTTGGLSIVKDIPNVKYVLKTRTDQRLLLPDFIVYMKNMLGQYPPAGNEVKRRVAFLGGLNSLLLFPFRITDFMTFGDVTDICKFYDITEYPQKLKKSSEEDASKHYLKMLGVSSLDNYTYAAGLSSEERKRISNDMCKTMDPESFLTSYYYEHYITGRSLSDEEDQLILYWSFLKRYAVILDPDYLIFYWHKYTHRYMSINGMMSDGGLTHSAWLSVLQNPEIE